MDLGIDRQALVPVVQQIISAVAQWIRKSGASPGTRLPSIRQLALDNLLSQSSVIEAFERMVAQGLLASKVSKLLLLWRCLLRRWVSKVGKLLLLWRCLRLPKVGKIILLLSNRGYRPSQQRALSTVPQAGRHSRRKRQLSRSSQPHFYKY